MTFELNTVLDEKINNASLRAYCIRFDFGICQIESLAEILMDALVDYAYGFHQGIQEQYTRRKLKEAAVSLYKIKGYENAKKMKAAGANIFVVGTASIFSKDNTLDEGIKKMRKTIEE